MRYTKKGLLKSKIDVNYHHFILSIIKITLITIYVVMVASKFFNIPMSSFVTVFGVVGFSLTLAIKDSLANLAGGFIIMLSKTFSRGDLISINDVEGFVQEVGLVYTKLSTIDNKTIFIPNSELSKSTLINYSNEANRKLSIKFAIDYSANITLAKELIGHSLTESNLVLLEPEEPLIAVAELDSSSVNIVVRVWCRNDDYLPLKYFLNENVKQKFNDNNINIPFNRMDISVVK